MHFPQLLKRAERIVQQTIRTLPAALQDPAQKLPVVYERTPEPDLAMDDIDEDTLGLFIGSARGEDPGADPLPAQIILYLDNIWDYAEEDITAFDDEVRLTYLHELGHYLGLGEGDLEKRGLE